MQKTPINIQTSWDFTPLFKGDNDKAIFQKRKAVEKASYDFINKWKTRTDYLSKVDVLKEALDEYNAWLTNYGIYHDELYYFGLRTAQDQLDSNLKAKYHQGIEIAHKIQNDIQFFSLQLAKVAPAVQKRFLASPKLTAYKHYLELLFLNAKHLLSDPEEKIMNLKSQTSHSNWVHMTEQFLSREERSVIDESGKKQMKPFSEFGSLMTSSKKKVRDSAAAALNDVMAKYIEVAEHELNSILANKKIDDELRHFSRPDEASLIADDVDTKVVDQLIKTVSSRFDIARRWYFLKARLMKVKKLDYQDRMASLGTLDTKYSLKQAVKLVYSVMTGLDPEFGSIFTRFVENGQVDFLPKKGKADGGFCAAGSVKNPTYILLNFTGKLQDILTLAHETGHGINNELMRQKTNALNFGSPLSTAEVASTFFEDFVNLALIKEAKPKDRLVLLTKKMDDEVATIFRQVACYQFEQELHQEFRKKGYLNHAQIGEIFQKHMADYMGDSVSQNEGSQNWWVYWGHIRSFFYVYSYASGLMISKSLQANVKKDPAFINKVKDFLSQGTTDSPKHLFKKLNVDITKRQFWESGLEELEALLGEIEELALKLKKI